MHTICGLFRNDTEEPEYVQNGFPRYFAEELQERGGAGAPKDLGQAVVLPMYPREFQSLSDDLVSRESNLSVYRSTVVTGATATSNGWRISIQADRQKKTDVPNRFTGDVLLDTTGDAAVAEMAGAETMTASTGDLQLPSYIVKISGVPPDLLEGFEKLTIQHHIAKGIRKGDLPEACKSVLLRPAREEGTGFMTINLPRKNNYQYDPLDEEQLNRVEQEARDRAQTIVSYLRRNSEKFSDLEVKSYPDRLGVRETRRVSGKKVVDRDHVLEGRSDPEGVALSAWPIELWQNYESPELIFPGGPCEIPLGALVSRTFDSLGTAGRCVSATHKALGSLRVIGTSMAMGEAIGLAGALSDPDGGLSSVSVDRITSLKIKNTNPGKSLSC